MNNIKQLILLLLSFNTIEGTNNCIDINTPNITNLLNVSYHNNCYLYTLENDPFPIFFL